MRTLILPFLLLGAATALLSGPAQAGEIVILDSGSRHRGDRARDPVLFTDPLGGSIIILERPSRDEELGRRDPGLEARRASRKASVLRRSKDQPLPSFDEEFFDAPLFLDSTVPFGLGRGDPGREAARAAADARRMRLEKQ
ncbi:hypothetical protein [Azospirillum rugosum]|uniref:Uncharacterized protein n=1 Tax=Azospirillum rugosum TaxID=416170 RepID=A0ABS4SLB0_9PROT|nr:hypothetical protein [Azospirillum rugosum]MBP2293014.1 hypothetical protein [Azospirillum rugosum]MDQ0526563.1 hypothetical protein [Azospirillum rugosum]